MKSVRILSKTTLTSLINVRHGEIVYIEKDYNPNLAIKVGKVFTDRHSYTHLCNKNSFKPQIPLYVDLGNWDFKAKKFLRTQKIYGYTYYELNKNFSIILFRNENNAVFYITVPTMNIPIFETCYLHNIELQDHWWHSSDDLSELLCFVMKTLKPQNS